MATRPQFSPYIVIPNAAAQPANTGSMAASIIGAPTIIQKLSMISYQFVWTGASPVGTVSIEVSNDYAQNADGTVKNPGNWDTITFSYNGTLESAVPVTGNSGHGFLDINAHSAYAMRPVYTFTSGTGTLTVTINAKVS